MIRSDITTEPQAGPYSVRKVGERWLVVRQIAGVDAVSVVADCRTEHAARNVADEFNGLRARYEGGGHA
jgi:hypothetical protein